MSRLEDEELGATRDLFIRLVRVIELEELEANGPLGRQLEAQLRGALAVLEAVLDRMHR